MFNWYVQLPYFPLLFCSPPVHCIGLASIHTTSKVFLYRTISLYRISKACSLRDKTNKVASSSSFRPFATVAAPNYIDHKFFLVKF
uniref:Putative secreted protein n=1 Tax=Xenopsylla cheopis TaxID=163159 RepID=A0A6M2DW23_XENCH